MAGMLRETNLPGGFSRAEIAESAKMITLSHWSWDLEVGIFSALTTDHGLRTHGLRSTEERGHYFPTLSLSPHRLSMQSMASIFFAVAS
jgi:hypothetical protein